MAEAIATATSFTYDVDDRNTTYTYNYNGDVLNDGTHTFSYDFEDHLIGSGTGATQTASYAYDADGNRIQKVTDAGSIRHRAQLISILSGLNPSQFGA